MTIEQVITLIECIICDNVHRQSSEPMMQIDSLIDRELLSQQGHIISRPSSALSLLVPRPSFSRRNDLGEPV
jgi:hypothetical protein